MITIGASSAASASRSRVARAMANGSTGRSTPSIASAARTANARAGARRSTPPSTPSSSSARPDQASSTSASTPARRQIRQSGWSTAMIAAAASTTADLPIPASPTIVRAPPSPTAAPAASPAIASTTSWRPYSGRRSGDDVGSVMAGGANTRCLPNAEDSDRAADYPTDLRRKPVEAAAAAQWNGATARGPNGGGARSFDRSNARRQCPCKTMVPVGVDRRVRSRGQDSSRKPTCDRLNRRVRKTRF